MGRFEQKSASFTNAPPCLSHNAQINPTQPAITCLKLTKETLEQGVKYVQS